MIENEELGLKIAENPREALIKQVKENTEQRILQTELTLELERHALEFLKTLSYSVNRKI
jgi:hypothetical protein